MGWMEELKSPGAVQSLLADQGPRLAAAVFAALLAIQAGVLVTSQNGGSAARPGAEGTAAGSSSRAPADSRRPALQVPAIVAAHLFGDAAPATGDGNAPQTAAQLVLAGVLAVPDPKRGLAILGPSAAAARLYAVGMAVPGGVSLHAVYPDHVLLERGGAIESLQLPKKFVQAAPPPPTAAIGPQTPGQRLAALAQGNGALLGGLLRATPLMLGGKLSGFRIYPGSRASMATFNKLGLQANDVVTAVNGTPLDDLNRGNEILQTLSSAATATLTVLRNGQQQDVNLNLAVVANDAENAAAQAAAAGRRGGAFGGPAGMTAGGLTGRGVPGMAGSVAAPGSVDDGGATPPSDAAPDKAPNDQ
ncbi:MAG TPA: type II secretion system protein GspC [Steroidobacteraceae bacterium]|nr:type II secretion system protein GspC [Steroidobacteraceae bacterium]